MTNTQSKKPQPAQTNYAVHIREYVDEWMEDNSVSMDSMATLLAMKNAGEVEALLSSSAPLSQVDASRLEFATGIVAKAWMRLDAQYWKDVERLGL